MTCFQRFSYILAIILLAASVSTVSFAGGCGKEAVQSISSCVPRGAASHLGHGINYLVSNSPISQVLELSKANVMNIPISTYNGKEIKASSSAEFSHQLALSAGLEMSYGGFEADASAKVNKSGTHSTSANYSSESRYYTASRYYLGSLPGPLQNITTQEFKNAVKAIGNTSTADSIFKGYGTHVVISTLVGAEFELRSDSTSSATMTKDCFEAHVHAKYDALTVDGSISADYSMCSEENKSSNSISQYIFTKGGNTTLGNQLDVNSSRDEVKAWAATTSDSSKQIYIGCGYKGADAHRASNCYVAIWDLISDPDKRSAVKNAFHKYLALHPIIKIFSHSETASVVFGESVESTVTLPGHGTDWRLLSGGAEFKQPDIHNITGARPPLLKATYPASKSQWTSRMARANGNYPTGTQANSLTVTTYALALYDPLGIWKTYHHHYDGTTDDRHKHTKANNYGVLTNQVSLSDDYTLVGGGAKVNLPQNQSLAQMPPTMKGPYLTASFPDPIKKNNWVSQFTNMITYNYGCDPSSPYHFGCNDAYNVNGGPPKKLMDTIVNAKLSWTQIDGQSPINYHSTHYDSTMSTYAIGIKLNDEWSQLGVSTLQEVVTQKLTGATHPLAQSTVNSCSVNGENIQYMTGGGARGIYNITPFFLTSTFPSGHTMWQGQSSNDVNYLTYSSRWHDINTKYHKRHWEIPLSGHSPSYNSPQIAGTLYSYTNSVIFTDNPKDAKKVCETVQQPAKGSGGGVLYPDG